MPLNIIISGVGGQGNVFASQVVGAVAVKNGFYVTIGETFGLSQRGGPVMSHIRISKEKTYGPLIPPNQADIIIGLEPLESLRIIKQYGNDKTIFIVNARPIYPLNVTSGEVAYPKLARIKEVIAACAKKLYWIDATKEALKLGNPILMNMIILGAASGLAEIPFETDHFKTALKSFLPESKLSVNFSALETGRAMVFEA